MARQTQEPSNQWRGSKGVNQELSGQPHVSSANVKMLGTVPLLLLLCPTMLSLPRLVPPKYQKAPLDTGFLQGMLFI